MTEGDFVRSIDKAYRLFEQMGQARSFQVPVSLPVNAEFNKLALDTEIPYPEVFFCGLRHNHLNFILRDLTYFQFSRRSETEVRYAFYPSPFGPRGLAVVEEIARAREAEEIDDEEYAVAIEGLTVNYHRPFVRYEYSASQHKQIRHPASHFHIGTHGDDRWCIERFMSPYLFCLQMAKMYFGEDWEALTEERQPGIRTNEFDDLLCAERRECAITPIEMFDERERDHLHFR